MLEVEKLNLGMFWHLTKATTTQAGASEAS